MESFDNKLIELDNLIEQNEDSAEAYYNRARFVYDFFDSNAFDSYDDRHDYVHQITSDIKQAIKLDSKHVDAYCLRGLVYLRDENEELAELEFLRAIAFDPMHGESNFNLAVIDFNRGEIDEAFDKINKSLETNPDYGNSYLVLANIYGSMGNKQEMEANYQRAFDLLGEEPEVYHARALCYTADRRFDEALSDINKAIALAPLEMKFYQTKANIYQVLGDDVQYYTTLLDVAENEAVEREPHLCATLYANRGVARMRHTVVRRVNDTIDDKSQLILDDFEKALTYDPRFLTTFLYRAGFYQEQKEYDKALADYKTVIEMDSSGSQLAYQAKKGIRSVKEEMGIKTSFWDKFKDIMSQ